MEYCFAQLLATDRAVLSRAAAVCLLYRQRRQTAHSPYSKNRSSPKMKTVLMAMITAPSQAGAVTDR